VKSRTSVYARGQKCPLHMNLCMMDK